MAVFQQTEHHKSKAEGQAITVTPKQARKQISQGAATG
jgi:hypothetical protein